MTVSEPTGYDYSTAIAPYVTEQVERMRTDESERMMTDIARRIQCICPVFKGPLRDCGIHGDMRHVVRAVLVAMTEIAREGAHDDSA